MNISPLKNLKLVPFGKKNAIQKDYNVSLNKNTYKPKPTSVVYKPITQPINQNLGVLPESVLRQKIAQKRINTLSPSADKSEYDKIISDILKYTISKFNFTFNVVIMNGYNDIDKNFIGLVPYCGLGDISKQINSWLTGRSFEFSDVLTDEKMTKIVKALEYSLKQLDEKFGKYTGKIYRVGYFNPNSDKQFYSASKRLACAAKHAEYSPPEPETPYSIIKVKNGHDIHKFQLDTNSKGSLSMAKDEQEVLIDRRSKFRKIPKEEYSKEDIKDILLILKISMGLHLEKEDLPEFAKKIDTLNYISIWEEI